MSGPAVVILLPEELTPLQLAKIESDILAISDEVENVAPGVWYFYVKNTYPLGGHHKLVHGRSFVFGADPADTQLGPDELAQIASHFGFEPRMLLEIAAFCKGPEDHAILGTLGLHFAELLHGVIDIRDILSIHP